MKEDNIDDTINASNKSEKTDKAISNKAYYLLCFLIFLNIGITVNISVWASSYATLSNICSKEKAVIFPALYCFALSLMRFLATTIPLKSS